jgi:hypothetical protein
LKRLALLWLVCAVAGFTVAAGVVVVLSFTFDNGGRPAAAPSATHAAELRPAPAD